jgi:two-component system osmolarity sensor histidine kinase EnvZ
MALSSEHISRSWIKRYLPASLFGRALLILVLPMLLMQAVAVYIFFELHWDNVERHLSMSLVGDVAFLEHEMQHAEPKHRLEVERLAQELMHIDVRLEPFDPEIGHFPSKTDDDVFMSFATLLHETIDEPFLVRRGDHSGHAILLIRLNDSVLRMQFSTKRLESVTTEIFVFWMIGSAVLLLVIATVFLRNQIRPIRKLALAAESFGKGQESVDFRPQGASEVRQAGRSFLAMRERLKRMLTARTEMLAAISHDLRTPLTRMRLALAMLPDQKYVKPLLADVQDMEKMIQEYLDFARGDGGEPPRSISVSALLGEVVERYGQQGGQVTLALSSDPQIIVFRNAMRRCFYNIIDNALKYGSRCEVRAQEMANRVEIILDDNGPGIPAAQRERALQPFKRLDESRNPDAVGAGLGLSIVQDIVLRHGGELKLEDSPLGGLRVRIRLPL